MLIVETGYVKLWRKIEESAVFMNAELLRTWVWCLIQATHERHYVPIRVGRGFTEVELYPGEFIYGRKYASRKLHIPLSTVRNHMKILEEMGNLNMKPNTHFTIVTICNWDIYQFSNDPEGQPIGQQKDNNRTTKGQREDTSKKDKNEDNEKKEEVVNENVMVEAKRLAQLLFDMHKMNDPNRKYPDFDSWTMDMYGLINEDNRKPNQIEEVIIWCHKPIQFWSPIIINPQKLRHHFDKLFLALKNKGTNTAKAGHESCSGEGYCINNEQDVWAIVAGIQAGGDREKEGIGLLNHGAPGLTQLERDEIVEKIKALDTDPSNHCRFLKNCFEEIIENRQHMRKESDAFVRNNSPVLETPNGQPI